MFEPPASLITRGTIAFITAQIIALIFGGERHTIMVRKWIAGSSYKDK